MLAMKMTFGTLVFALLAVAAPSSMTAAEGTPPPGQPEARKAGPDTVLAQVITNDVILPSDPDDRPCGTGVLGQGEAINDPRCLGGGVTRPPEPQEIDPGGDLGLSYRVSVPPGDTLNVRAGPHYRSRKVLALRNGVVVRGGQPQRQRDGSFWARVCAHQVCGWSNSQYLAPVGRPDHQPGGEFLRVVGVASNDVLWIRSQPSVRTGARIGAIPPNAGNVQYLGSSQWNGNTRWVLVQYGNTRGWASSNYLAR